MRIFIVTIAFMFLSCGKRTEKANVQPNPKVIELRKRYDAVKASLSFDQATGWPTAKDCDATLWAGLALAAGVETVKLNFAEYASGEIHRRPNTECYPKESNSTVSRDMILGYAFGAWRSRDRSRFDRLVSYGEWHNWVMGDGSLGETLLTGNLIGLLGRAIEVLDGPKKIYRVIPPIYSRDRTDYVMHLTVLFILLNGEIVEKLPNKNYSPAVSLQYPSERTTTEISKNEKDILRWLSSQDSNDLLFKTAFSLYDGGNMDSSIDGLLLENFYVPPYVRGDKNYRLVHWLFTVKLILSRS